MLRSVKDLIGYPVMATDGKAGKVKDVLFGDRHWRMRYLDVETRVGLHLSFRYLSDDTKEREGPTRRLLSPEHLGQPKVGLDRKGVPTDLSVDGVSEQPGFDSRLPVEERYEMEFRRFFRHAIYDDRPMLAGFGNASYVPPISAYEHSDEELREHLERMSEIAGEHLHSAHAVFGYHVRGGGENLGALADLILDTESWQIAYFVLDTRHGIPSRKHLIAMDSIEKLDWSSSAVEIRQGKEALARERRFWPYDPVNRDEAEHEYDYYGKPCLKNLMEELY